MSKKTSTWVNDRELYLSRLIDAPPELVFKAWTDPEMMKHWFVPKPWSIARVENDVRPGIRIRVSISTLFPAAALSLPTPTSRHGSLRKSPL